MSVASAGNRGSRSTLTQELAARYPADEQGRCATCGFLSVASDPGGWYEATGAERRGGTFTRAYVPGFPNAWQTGDIACFVSAAELAAEMAKDTTGNRALDA